MNNRNLQQFNIYPSFRKFQEETINKIIDFVHNSNKRFLLVQAPTGSGKSIVAYVASSFLVDEYAKLKAKSDKTYLSMDELQTLKSGAESSYIVTSKNLLLDQYYNDFHKHIPVAKGRANYICSTDGRPCSEGICLTKPRPSQMNCFLNCPYQKAKRNFLASPVSATNFALLLKLLRVPGFAAKDVVFIDECQAIESSLREEFVVQITESTINLINKIKETMRCLDGHEVENIAAARFEKRHGNYKKIDVSNLDANSLDDVNLFLESLHEEIINLYLSLSESIDIYVEEECMGDLELACKEKEFKRIVRTCDHLKHLSGSIKDYFSLKNQVEWIVQEHRTEKKDKITGFEVKPVTIELLTESIFKQIANKKVVMLSATIGNPEIFARDLGIKKGDYEFIDIPSTFPIENRPFIRIPVGSMSYKDKDKTLPIIVDACDEILENYPNQKGIIHSVTFKNALYLKEHMKNSDRILIHDQVNKDLVLRQFKESTNKILVSPSLIEGFDFKGKLSEFQIFIKVPYLDMKDKVVARRKELNPEWYFNSAVLQILQGVGRSIRSEEDVAPTYFLDTNINFLLNKYRHLFTSDFLSTVMKCS